MFEFSGAGALQFTSSFILNTIIKDEYKNWNKLSDNG